MAPVYFPNYNNGKVISIWKDFIRMGNLIDPFEDDPLETFNL